MREITCPLSGQLKKWKKENGDFALFKNNVEIHWERRKFGRIHRSECAIQFENEIAQTILHNSYKYKWLDLPPILQKIGIKTKTKAHVIAWEKFKRKYDEKYEKAIKMAP